MKFRSKNLLITGGAGFIGSNFIEYVFEKNKEVNIYNLDLLTYAGDLINTRKFKNNKKYKFIKGDICDTKFVNDIFKEYKIDGVINFAAESHVDNSIKNPEIFIKTNIHGVFNLLNICFKNWFTSSFNPIEKFKNSRFHQISTDEVYGSIDEGSFYENSNYNPNSPYSASKASADMLTRSFNQTYGLNTTISICSNNFGKNQNIEKFIPKIIHCLENNIEIPVYGNGLNIRDWIHVKDHCRAVHNIFSDAKSGELFNISSGNEISNLELIRKISGILELESKVKFIKDRDGHDFRYSLNSQKIERILGFKSSLNLNDYIKEYKS